MNICFVSSLTPEDEQHVAQVILKVVSDVLEFVPLPYALRIEVDTGEVFQHSSVQGRRSPGVEVAKP